jgi:hypothetical protein
MWPKCAMYDASGSRWLTVLEHARACSLQFPGRFLSACQPGDRNANVADVTANP